MPSHGRDRKSRREKVIGFLLLCDERLVEQDLCRVIMAKLNANRLSLFETSIMVVFIYPYFDLCITIRIDKIDI